MTMSRRALLQQGQAPPLVQRQPCYQNSPAPHTVAARSTQQSSSLRHSSSVKRCQDSLTAAFRHFVPQSSRRASRSKSLQVCAANSGYGADDLSARRKNRLPPNLLARVLAAFFYIVPWMDITIVGWEYHHSFPNSAILHVIPGPFLNIYYSSQFAPLIIFFLLFLSVVKNFRLHHFTRFHCMQAIVLDIVTMLFTLVRQYFPAEFRWSSLMHVYDMFAYNMCMVTIMYCIICALMGYYANITYVSESTYMQVEEGT